MSQFKVRDRVRCVDNSGDVKRVIEHGNEYTVSEVMCHCHVKLEGIHGTFLADRFSLIDDTVKHESQLDPINPPHYQQHPSGVECITITEAFNFNLGNAIKYIWRAGLKGDAATDLEKAAWYLERAIEEAQQR